MDTNESNNLQFKFPKWVAILLIISLVLNFIMYLNIKSMKNDIANLQNNINSINSSVNSTIQNNVNQISEMLRKETSLVSEFKYEMGEYKDKRIDFLLSLKPKAYTMGEKLYFSCKSGNSSPTLFEAQSSDNITFSAKINVSLFDNVDIDLIIDNGSTKKTEKLESIYRPVEKIAAQLNARGLGGSFSYDRKKGALITTYDFELIGPAADLRNYKLSDVKLDITVNDKTVDSKQIQKDQRTPLDRYSIQLQNYEISCKAGDIIKIYITAKDDKGFNYKSVVQGWKVREDGALDESPLHLDMGRVEIS